MTCRTARRGGLAIVRRTAWQRAPDGLRPGARRVPRPAWRALPRRPAARRVLAGLVGVLLSLAVVGLALAEDGSEPARRVAEAAIAAGVQAFAKPDPSQPELSGPEAQRRLRVLIDQHVDIPRIARSILGRHWRAAATEQQDTFLALFETYLINAFAGAAANMAGVTFGPVSVIEAGDALTVVRTDMRLAGEPPRPVLIALGRADDGSWRILDVVAEAISLTKTMGADFSAFLRLNGGKLEVLNATLQQRLTVSQAAEAGR